MKAPRQSSDWESWIDQEIRKAQERGAFDALPGAGKRVDLTPDPHARGQELGFKILKDAGFAPEWIEMDKAIRGKLAQERAQLAQRYGTWQTRMKELDDRSDAWAEVERKRILAGWENAVASFERALGAINRQIRELNLKVPGPRFQRSILDVDSELARVKGGQND
jgi:DnaJ family protein C protein 28